MKISKLKRVKYQHDHLIPASLVKQIPMEKPFGIVTFMDMLIPKPKWLPRKVKAVMIKEN